jgi:hypothetical protein
VPAEVIAPLRPPGVERCPNIGLSPLIGVLGWTAPPSLALQVWARAQLVHPLGTIVRDVVEGQPVIARIECHYAYGAHPDQAPQWHKGTSVYRPARRTEGGAMVAITTPPDGWPSSV